MLSTMQGRGGWSPPPLIDCRKEEGLTFFFLPPPPPPPSLPFVALKSGLGVCVCSCVGWQHQETIIHPGEGRGGRGERREENGGGGSVALPLFLCLPTSQSLYLVREGPLEQRFPTWSTRTTSGTYYAKQFLWLGDESQCDFI